MYVLPNELNPNSEWHGAYFVRQGLYSRAILKFKIVFPDTYPKEPPHVIMQSKVYHPLINFNTGHVNLDAEFKNWQPGHQWVVNVLLYVKKLFHLEEFFSLHCLGDEATVKSLCMNKEAHETYNSDFKLFLQKTNECV